MYLLDIQLVLLKMMDSSILEGSLSFVKNRHSEHSSIQRGRQCSHSPSWLLSECKGRLDKLWEVWCLARRNNRKGIHSLVVWVRKHLKGRSSLRHTCLQLRRFLIGRRSLWGSLSIKKLLLVRFDIPKCKFLPDKQLVS